VVSVYCIPTTPYACAIVAVVGLSKFYPNTKIF